MTTQAVNKMVSTGKSLHFPTQHSPAGTKCITIVDGQAYEFWNEEMMRQVGNTADKKFGPWFEFVSAEIEENRLTAVIDRFGDRHVNTLVLQG